MSLDVYLIRKSEPKECICDHCGSGYMNVEDETVYEANITHNLGEMADVAGIYEYLWRPDEIKVENALELIEPLRIGLKRLKAEPETFKPLSASNGWGTYKQFVPFVEKYLDACINYPDAKVEVSR